MRGGVDPDARACRAQTATARSGEYLRVAGDRPAIVELGYRDQQGVVERGLETPKGQARQDASLQHEVLDLIRRVRGPDRELPQEGRLECEPVALALTDRLRQGMGTLPAQLGQPAEIGSIRAIARAPAPWARSTTGCGSSITP